MRSPIVWLGGKGVIVKKILPLMPDCFQYVEPFGGGASMLLAREPAEREVYNDIDNGLSNFFKVLSDPELFEDFIRRVAVLPFSRKIFQEFNKEWALEADPVVKATKWYVIARQSFGGNFGGSWGFAVTMSSRFMGAEVARWLGAIDALPALHSRLQRVVIECNDWRKIFNTYDTYNTLFYVDPPYYPDTRRAGEYTNELSVDDHRDLIVALRALKGMVVLSGYDNELYQQLDADGWDRVEFKVTCMVAGRTRHSKLQGVGAASQQQGRTEVVWRNPQALPTLKLF